MVMCLKLMGGLVGWALPKPCCVSVRTSFEVATVMAVGQPQAVPVAGKWLVNISQNRLVAVGGGSHGDKWSWIISMRNYLEQTTWH